MARAHARLGTSAFVLHSHDWSESSLILELFTRDHGRVVAVAKGAKRPYSQLRPVLMPFQRLVLGFGVKRSEDAEIWLLRQAEWAGGPAWPGGTALLSGFYINELLMRLMVRHEPHPELFDAYVQTLQAMGEPTLLQAALRAYELILLRRLGYLPSLVAATIDGQPVQANHLYELHPELGVCLVHDKDESAGALLSGATLTQIDAALSAAPVVLGGLVRGGHDAHSAPCPSAVPTLMAACMPALSELKSSLRALIHYHLDSHMLRTRQLMMELQQS